MIVALLLVAGSWLFFGWALGVWMKGRVIVE